MRRKSTKIICATLASVCALGVVFATACTTGDYPNRAPLGDYAYQGEVEDNGGFAVKAGKYVYFINGVESNTADNTYGEPVKGSVVRISESDLAAHNYSKVDTVVPLVQYESLHCAGLFIYGDRIYYATPSTAKNSDGEVLNGNTDFKSSSLNGSTMRSAYYTAPSNSYEYRYVQVDGTVYLVYVASNESLFGESTGVINLHSYNTVTGKDSLLAYNVSNVLFDGENKSNPQIYYTMNAYDFDNDKKVETYNQVYTVRADAEENRYDGSAEFNEWDAETDYYYNSGKLVYDGIGKMQAQNATPFNYAPDGSVYNELPYTYDLKHYQNGMLFYTRKTSSQGSSGETAANLFILNDGDAQKADRNAVGENYDDSAAILKNGASASNYQYIFEDGNFKAVIIPETTGISVNRYTGGKLQPKIKDEKGSDYFHLVKAASATVLFVEGDYVYYSTGGTNGVNFCRVNYTGDYGDYGYMPVPDGDGNTPADEYTPVQVLNVDGASDWYGAKIIDGQLLFATETGLLNNYNYIGVCDLRNGAGNLMTNAELYAYNELFDGVEEDIKEAVKDLDAKLYANLEKALNFAFYTGDSGYIKELAKVCNENAKKDDEDADDVYSDKTLAKYEEFVNATGEWAKYKENPKQINGETVYANRQEYYYSVLGKMTEGDKAALFDDYKASYLEAWPENEQTWWEGLSTAARVWFIIGMCAIGLLVIGGTVVLAIFLVKRKKNKLPEYTKKRIKVDTTDDKSVDVYSSDDEAKEESPKEE